MRLMIVGQLEGYISTAGKIALQRGAKVIHCEDKDQALGALLNGRCRPCHGGCKTGYRRLCCSP